MPAEGRPAPGLRTAGVAVRLLRPVPRHQAEDTMRLRPDDAAAWIAAGVAELMEGDPGEMRPCRGGPARR
jgi:hypothetical protein